MSTVRDFTAAPDDLARVALRDLAEHTGLLGTAVTVARPDPWLATQMQTLRTTVTQYCPHLDSTTSDLAFAAVWAPGHLVCRACIPTLTAVCDRREANTCDRCRHHAPPIRPCVAAVGRVLLVYGLCRTCLTHAGPSRKDTTS